MKIKRILSVMLIVAVSLALISCSGDDAVETTAPDTGTLTTAPHTEITTEAPPPELDEFLILRDSNATDHIVSEGNDSSLGARGELFRQKFGMEIIERDDADIVKTVRTAVLSGRSDDYGALLLTSENAVSLLCEGHLQDLSAAGIEADAHLSEDDINRTLTFGGGMYMLYSDALPSKYDSACGVLYRADTLDGELASLVLDGGFTLEALINKAKSFDSSFSTDLNAKGISLVYQGLGGKLFKMGEAGLPAVSLDGDGDSAAYGALFASSSSITQDGGIFKVSKLSEANGEGIYLPMPKANAEQKEYVTPIDIDTASVLAVPDGITNGSLVGDVFAFFSETFGDAHERIVRTIAPAEGDARLIAKKLVDSLSIELSSLYGWGDMNDYLFDNLTERVEFGALRTDKRFADRCEAVNTAAAIIKNRIEK
jgi:hypothetical protein